MMLTTATQMRAAGLAMRSSAPKQQIALPARPSVRTLVVRAGETRENDTTTGFSASRRILLLSVPGAVFAPQWAASPAFASVGYEKFLGYNQQPDLYMGYGQAQDTPAQYSFEYPADWEEQAVTKTDKSTMGMDGMVKNPNTRKEQAYVIALGGKDYRDSVLKDAKTSLIVIAGGDPDLRQAVTDGEVKQTSKTINGTPMYTYEIASDKRNYLATIGKRGDTVYALVVTAPHAAYEKDSMALKHIQDTFQLL